ncbi:MAG: fibronectin type III domain-containing protein [Ferruginibacter sp.]
MANGIPATTNSGISVVPDSAIITGLVSNTLYHFKDSASNTAGNGSGSDLTFTTPPNAPTGITAATATATGFTVSWTAPTSIGAGYTYTVNASTSPSFSPVAATANVPSGTTYTFTTLSATTTYYYEVKSSKYACRCTIISVEYLGKYYYNNILYRRDSMYEWHWSQWLSGYNYRCAFCSDH